MLLFFVFLQDAHNCILEFDEETAMFAVYDGHGGNTHCRFCVIVQHALCNVDLICHFLPKLKSGSVLSLSFVVSQPSYKYFHTPTLSVFLTCCSHLGEEVALYCSKYLPEIIKEQKTYKDGKLQKVISKVFWEFGNLCSTIPVN